MLDPEPSVVGGKGALGIVLDQSEAEPVLMTVTLLEIEPGAWEQKPRDPFAPRLEELRNSWERAARLVSLAPLPEARRLPDLP